ncbi:diglucosyl diacylglycerol synthase [Bacillus sp. RO1]|uniref:diglucosyl diacylglycerol synthase n=1 Tax=Bacillus sp. RO1 TaxID=2722703 RepID=UPI0014571802|nr:diglucosyl diacylglycerol synthase [Bacillus sp. RO1]NLP49246.1 diglucosyl diacylglycerol synthase [Bacillus sp. RO1]
MKNNGPKVIILTASYGNGHLQVANSLYQECVRRGYDNVKICNLYAESHPFISEVTEKLYSKSFTYGKQFYKLFYYGTDFIQNKKMLRWYYQYGFKRLTSLIDTEKPDILINTFPINAVPEFRRRTGIVIPTYNIITDYCLHSLWLHDDIDKYYVASNELKAKIHSRGVPESKVMVSGIPIRPSFSQSLDKRILFDKYQISPKKDLILLIAGAHGVLKNIKETCETLLLKTDHQLAVVCGKNHSLRNEMAHLENRYRDRFHCFGYLERIDELYRLASVMVTKPGGITLTEATATGTPLILYMPVPGQEKENALFFSEKGAALTAKNQEELLNNIDSLLKSKQKQLSLQSSIKKLYLPSSQEMIMTDILKESERISLMKNHTSMKSQKKKLGS